MHAMNPSFNQHMSTRNMLSFPFPYGDNTIGKLLDLQKILTTHSFGLQNNNSSQINIIIDVVI